MKDLWLQDINYKSGSTKHCWLIHIISVDRTIYAVLGGHQVTGTESWGVRYGNYHISTNIVSFRLSESPMITRYIFKKRLY